MQKKARLIFEDGTEFFGRFFTAENDSFGEVVFNTAMTGYQEVISDPSYFRQMVVMTYPIIGNYGINPADMESASAFLSALIVREYCDTPSNYRATQTLKSYLEAHSVVGIEDVDTRALTRFVRERGAQKAIITGSDRPAAELIATLRCRPGMIGANLADQVTASAPYVFPSEGDAKTKVAVLDFGVKTNILRMLAARGIECHVFPSTTGPDAILGNGFDGVFLSNGPGDPEAVSIGIATVKQLVGKLPIFGICLGHQILGLALGAKTVKLPFGHHGVNHPVKRLSTGAVEITSQNHGFSIDTHAIPSELEVTHINLNDRTVEGIRHKSLPVFSVQYHPESAPGPHDSAYLFDDFVALMRAQH